MVDYIDATLVKAHQHAAIVGNQEMPVSKGREYDSDEVIRLSKEDDSSDTSQEEVA